jgi:hypothetical protein
MRLIIIILRSQNNVALIYCTKFQKNFNSIAVKVGTFILTLTLNSDRKGGTSIYGTIIPQTHSIVLLFLGQQDAIGAAAVLVIYKDIHVTVSITCLVFCDT